MPEQTQRSECDSLNPTSTITLRPFERKDLCRVVELCRSHAEFEQSQIGPQFCRDDLAELFLSEPPCWFCFVVEKQNQIFGYVTYGKQISTWEAGYYLYVDCLYLDESIRGQGLGARVMKMIAKEAERLNCATVQWQTPCFNEAAIRFYQRLGATGKRKLRFEWRM